MKVSKSKANIACIWTLLDDHEANIMNRDKRKGAREKVYYKKT